MQERGSSKGGSSLDSWMQVEILNLLGGHPNIPQLRAAYEDREGVHMVMEWCSGESPP